MTESQDVQESLADLADVPMTISVGGTDYPIRKLRPIDLAEASEWVVTERKNKYLKNATVNEVLNPLHAEVLSRLELSTLDAHGLCHDPIGRMKLVELAMRRAGSKMTYAQIVNDLDPQHSSMLFRKLCVVSGLLPSKSGDECSDPPKSIDATNSTDVP